MLKKILIAILPIIFIFAVIFCIRFIFGGSEDDWICKNNEWVRHGNPSAPKPTESCGELKQENLIKIEKPQENEEIISPLVLEGEARGGWFFEADAPVVLLDANEKGVVFGFINAKGDWMTTDFVRFGGEFEFETPETETGTLVFMKANPSGLPENNVEARIPIRFKKVEEKICENKCGDGECQEIVCLGTGCPCVETTEKCPEDCK